MVTGEASPKRVEGGGGRGLLEQNQYIERIGHGSVLVCPTRSADLLMLNMLAKAGWFSGLLHGISMGPPPRILVRQTGNSRRQQSQLAAGARPARPRCGRNQDYDSG